jgi:hypothetical protein
MLDLSEICSDAIEDARAAISSIAVPSSTRPTRTLPDE